MDDVGSDLCEFYEIALHNILYIRKVYPAGAFILKKKYGVPVYQIIHPELSDYIKNCLKAVEFHMKNNNLRKLFLCLHSEGEVIEKYTFAFGEQNDRGIKQAQSMRNFFLKLFTCDSYTGVLPPDATFSIQLLTGEEAAEEFDKSADINDFCWMKIAEESQGNPKIVPLETVIFDNAGSLQIFVEIFSMDH